DAERHPPMEVVVGPAAQRLHLVPAWIRDIILPPIVGAGAQNDAAGDFVVNRRTQTGIDPPGARAIDRIGHPPLAVDRDRPERARAPVDGGEIGGAADPSGRAAAVALLEIAGAEPRPKHSSGGEIDAGKGAVAV